jgi:hypothetical protein
MSLSSDKLKNFWKLIILAARREREFLNFDKLKPIILDEAQKIEDTIVARLKRMQRNKS